MENISRMWRLRTNTVKLFFRAVHPLLKWDLDMCHPVMSSPFCRALCSPRTKTFGACTVSENTQCEVLRPPMWTQNHHHVELKLEPPTPAHPAWMQLDWTKSSWYPRFPVLPNDETLPSSRCWTATVESQNQFVVIIVFYLSLDKQLHANNLRVFRNQGGLLLSIVSPIRLRSWCYVLAILLTTWILSSSIWISSFLSCGFVRVSSNDPERIWFVDNLCRLLRDVDMVPSILIHLVFFNKIVLHPFSCHDLIDVQLRVRHWASPARRHLSHWILTLRLFFLVRVLLEQVARALCVCRPRHSTHTEIHVLRLESVLLLHPHQVSSSSITLLEKSHMLDRRQSSISCCRPPPLEVISSQTLRLLSLNLPQVSISDTAPHTLEHKNDV